LSFIPTTVTHLLLLPAGLSFSEEHFILVNLVIGRLASRDALLELLRLLAEILLDLGISLTM
jgi:hypothetical protein